MNSSRISVVGLGYVGLPLALAFARRDQPVIGIDIDPAKVESLRSGKGYLQHVDTSDLSELLSSGLFDVTNGYEKLSTSEAIIICVPTPLGRHKEPDLSFIFETARNIGPYLQKKSLVVLESTTYPGTTDTDLRLILEERSGLRAGLDFHLAYSPEREDPGNEASHVGRIPKVVGGYTPECLAMAKNLYSKIAGDIVPVSSCRVAEAAKLLENIFRSVNIALVNELKIVYEAMDVDIWEVIAAAKTKPFGFMPFYPGPGLGGHCIPIDPFYLTWKAQEFGIATRFIQLAGEINTRMPFHVVEKVAKSLNERHKSVNGSRILVIGLAYKPDVDDIRESPSFILMEELEKLGAVVEYYDPYVSEIPATREHAKFKGKKSVTWDKTTIENFDCALIATAHKCISFQELAEWSRLIVDTRNAMGSIRCDHVVKS